jgi:hypothetical protein
MSIFQVTRTSLVGLIALAIVIWSGSIPFVTAQEFEPLFNGKDLSGWVLVNTPPDTWKIEDGMLICSGRPIGEIRTEKMYQNFEMEVEWRHMVPKGNAGPTTSPRPVFPFIAASKFRSLRMRMEIRRAIQHMGIFFPFMVPR